MPPEIPGYELLDQPPIAVGAPPAPQPTINPYLRATGPAGSQLQPDLIKQQYSGGIPQIRSTPFQQNANPGVNAAAKSTVIFESEGGGASSLLLETNGIKNPTQDVLNLQGSGVTTDAFGNVTIAAGNFAPFNLMLAPATVTPPVLSSLTWGNQGNALASYNAGGALYMTTWNSSNISILYKTAPSTPYTFTIGLVPGTGPGGAGTISNLAGIALRESSTSKLVTLMVGSYQSASQATELLNEYWSSYTTVSSVKYAGPNYPNLVAWLRVLNDGTNLTWSTAIDGQNFKVVLVYPLTDYFTSGPNQVGIGLYGSGTSSSTYQQSALFVHWSGI